MSENCGHGPKRFVTRPKRSGNETDTRDTYTNIYRDMYPEERVSGLYLKAEEYIERIRSSINPEVVRATICKLAILDHLLGEGGIANYAEAYYHALEGINLYGSEQLMADSQEREMLDQEFDQAYDVIEAYLTQGNEGVQDGTGLLTLGDL